MTRGRPEPADRLGRLRRSRTGPGKTDLLETTRRVQRGARRRLGHRDLRGGADPPRRARAAAARRGHGVLRAPRPACRSSRSRSTGRAGSGSGATIRVRVGEPLAGEGRADARGRRGADRADARQALLALVADFPDPPQPGRARPLADRGVQRLARGVATGARRRADGADRPRASRAVGAADESRAEARSVASCTRPAPPERPSRRSRGSHRPVRRPDRVPRPARRPVRRADRRLGARS